MKKSREGEELTYVIELDRSEDCLEIAVIDVRLNWGPSLTKYLEKFKFEKMDNKHCLSFPILEVCNQEIMILVSRIIYEGLHVSSRGFSTYLSVS